MFSFAENIFENFFFYFFLRKQLLYKLTRDFFKGLIIIFIPLKLDGFNSFNFKILILVPIILKLFNFCPNI